MLETYKHSCENDLLWDDFVLNNTVNGTFLQSRNFLNYHAEGKFKDHSILLGSKLTDLSAVVPACELMDGDVKVFYSHMGSTYGGPVISKQKYDLQNISAMIQALEERLRADGFSRVILKITPDIFSNEKTDLLQYLLTLNGYNQYTELSTFIDFACYDPDILSNFTYARQKQYKKCEKAGMQFRHITQDAEVAIFYNQLRESLSRYEVEPVHTLSELLDFKNSRLNDLVDFYGVEMNGEIVASSMSFNFKHTNTLHIQYSAANRGLGTLSPMTFLFGGLIKDAQERGMDKLSWGISTEDKGRKLNMALAETKESYGSQFAINRTFYKDF